MQSQSDMDSKNKEDVASGAAPIPAVCGTQPATSKAALDTMLQELAQGSEAWAHTGWLERVALLEAMSTRLGQGAEAMVADGARAKGLDPADEIESGGEWLGSAVTLARNLRLLAQTLRQIDTYGRPILPGPTRQLFSEEVLDVDGGTQQVAVRVFPTDWADRVFFPGYSAEVWLEDDVALDGVAEAMLPMARGELDACPVSVALVLGAGNQASIGAQDLLYKLFVENQVVVLKMNPVNDYLGPHFENIFASLIRRNVLRIAYGGADEGAYLCAHKDVASIHITGSDKTHDAIVYGLGPEGEARKQAQTPLRDIPISSELGNVSPVIVVPGAFSRRDLKRQARNVASMLTDNAGFNCNAARVLITHKEWPQRQAFIDAIAEALKGASSRKAYYPGAQARMDMFLAKHPTAQRLGGGAGKSSKNKTSSEGHLPWVWIHGLDPTAEDEICFSTEAFCGLMAETALPASSGSAFLQAAVSFCHQKLWGNLNAAVLVDPVVENSRDMGPAVARAIAQLRYGTVGINHWPALGYGMGSAPWGAYPGNEDHDIQSGRGTVHNTYLLGKIEKTVVRGPFRPLSPPPWWIGFKRGRSLGKALVAWESRRTLRHLWDVLLAALRG